jgi:predicted CoA-binding protein
MVTQQQITNFLANKPIAMAGVSRNKKKFGYTAFKELREKGLELIPINPNAEEIDGLKAYPSVSDIPDGIHALLIVTKKEQTASVVRSAREKGIKHIWIQQMSETPEALAEVNGADINLISKQCILMHHSPNGVHKFHRNIKKFFGRFPK